MTDLHSTAPVSAGAEAPATGVRHPATFAPATFILLLALSAFGAIIGVQLILQLGVTPNTSIIGALIAMLLARVPIAIFARYRSIHVQNLAQSAISAATFGAANSLLLPIGVPFLLGRSDLILPMLIGAALSMLLDAYLLYRMFDTRVFPATGTWPPGVAAAEAIKAGDEGGRKAALLGAGILVGVFGSWLKIPMSAFGVAFIGNVWALSMFGVGLLIRGYTQPLTGIDISKYYVPHGFMVGAGLVALVQVIVTISRRGGDEAAAGRSDAELGRALGLGSIGYPAIAIVIALLGGLASQMSLPMLTLFITRAAGRHRGDAFRLVPGLRDRADHADHRHSHRFPADCARPARRLQRVHRAGVCRHGIRSKGRLHLARIRQGPRLRAGRSQAAALCGHARVPDRDPHGLVRASGLFRPRAGSSRRQGLCGGD